MMFTVFLLVLVLLAISMAGIGIKILVKKKGNFSKSCSISDPATGKPLGCTCDNKPEGECENFNEHHKS